MDETQEDSLVPNQNVRGDLWNPRLHVLCLSLNDGPTIKASPMTCFTQPFK
jgi:hypothetical protein